MRRLGARDLWRLAPALAVVSVALLGCDDGAGAPDAGATGDGGPGLDAQSGGDAGRNGGGRDGGAGDDGGSAPSAGCFEGSVDLTVEADRVVAITAHYRLEAQADPATAEGWVRLLEAAYEEQVAIFEGGPAPSSLPLRVEVFRDEAAFRDGLRADGVGDVGDAGGYFEPSNETAYLYVQPTRYFTQVLLLHEAVHQIHDLARTAGTLPFWYIEGVAEALSRHDWDGRCARLGARPLLTQEDTPLAAREELARGGPSLAGIVAGAEVPTRAVAQSVLRYLTREDGGALAPAFVAFRRAVDGGASATEAFTAAFGAPADHEAAWRAFVEADQEPMAVVFLEWTHVDATTVLGRSPEVFSIARVKAPVSRFELSFERPGVGGWSGGVLLGYRDPSRWEALVVRSDGRLARFDVDGSAFWNDVGAAPDAVGGGWRFEVDYTPGRAAVTINGETFTFDTSLPPTSGPALDSGEIRFRDLRWRE